MVYPTNGLFDVCRPIAMQVQMKYKQFLETKGSWIVKKKYIETIAELGFVSNI